MSSANAKAAGFTQLVNLEARPIDSKRLQLPEKYLAKLQPDRLQSGAFNLTSWRPDPAHFTGAPCGCPFFL